MKNIYKYYDHIYVGKVIIYSMYRINVQNYKRIIFLNESLVSSL